jgi:hypothetical protein
MDNFVKGIIELESQEILTIIKEGTKVMLRSTNFGTIGEISIIVEGGEVWISIWVKITRGFETMVENEGAINIWLKQ